MILGILQARCSSTRLPGKVLASVLGEPMILRQIERLRRSTRLDEIVVATSIDPSDDPLVDVLAAAGVETRRGDLYDVVSRFALVADEFRPDHLVRLTADCPLADPDVVDLVIGAHLDTSVDYTSNTLDRTFAHGLDVECVDAAAFARMLTLPLTESEREHVTLALYGRLGAFTLHSVTQSPSTADLRWTVDVPQDLAFVRDVYGRLYDRDPSFTQATVLELLERHPELNRTGGDHAAEIAATAAS